MKILLQTAFLTLILNTFFVTFLNGQDLNFHCIQQYQKSDDYEDSIEIQTCYLKNFRFVRTSYPDYAGRYIYSEQKVFALKNKEYFEVSNSDVFNEKQGELVGTINKRILQDFKYLSTDKETKDCLSNIDLIPFYKMNDFEISFNENEIWFQVHWGLSSACRSVDGTIVSFAIEKIKKYLK